MKRFLYVDCDGVFNGSPELAYTDFAVYWPPIHSERRGDPYNVYKVQLLAELVIKHDITVIGISSWFGYKAEETLQELRDCPNFPLPIHRISKCTTGGTPRARAILDDVMEHQPDYWCILDDDHRCYERTNHPFYDKQPYFDIMGKLVSPHGRYGLHEEHIEQIGMLMGLTAQRYTLAYPLARIESGLLQYTDPESELAKQIMERRL